MIYNVFSNSFNISNAVLTIFIPYALYSVIDVSCARGASTLLKRNPRSTNLALKQINAPNFCERYHFLKYVNNTSNTTAFFQPSSFNK